MFNQCCGGAFFFQQQGAEKTAMAPEYVSHEENIVTRKQEPSFHPLAGESSDCDACKHLVVGHAACNHKRPDSRELRQSQRLRRFSRGCVALLAMAALLVCAANAQANTGPGPLTISAHEAQSVALAAASTYKVSANGQWADYKAVITIAVLNEAAKAAANRGVVLTTADYQSLATSVTSWLDSKAPAQFHLPDQAASLRYVMNSLIPAVSTAPAGSLLPHALANLDQRRFTELENPLNPSRQTPADLALFATTGKAFTFISKTIQEACDLAITDSSFAALVDPQLTALTGASSTSSYSNIKALYPAAVPDLPPSNPDGTFTINSAQLLAQYQAIVASAQAAIDANLTAIESGAAVAGPGSGTKFNAVTGTPPSSSSMDWNAAQTDVNEISKLVGLFNAQDAKEIASVGSATIQFGKSLDVLTQASGFFATAGALGGVVAAGIDIFSLFEGGPLSGSSSVLPQIQALSSQITRLQKDMDNRFNQLDATLNKILATLNSNFLQIDYQLGILNGDARAIQTGLLDVQAQLDRMEQYTLAYIQAQSKEAFLTEMNGCLNYFALHNGADIGAAKFQECENAAYSWSINDAQDELWAGLLNPDFSDSNIYSTLLNPISVNSNYLCRFPTQNMGISALCPTRIPNHNELIAGAWAYLQQSHEWPQYSNQISAIRIDDIVREGTAYRQAAQNGNSIAASGAPVANRPLFTGLANKCTAAVNDLQGSFQALENSFVSDPTNRLQGINLWGGTGQLTSAVPPIPVASTAVACVYPFSPRSASMDMPAGLLLRIPNTFRLAHALGVGNVTLTVTAQWAKVFPETCTPGNMAAQLRVFIHALYNGQEFESWFVTGQETWTCPQTGDNPMNYVLCNWDISSPCCTQPLRAKFEDPTQITNVLAPGFQQLMTAATNDISVRLAALQQALYGNIAGAFTVAGPVQVAAQKLTGDTLLVQDMTSFALPESVVLNDSVHGALFGDQGIMDGPKVQADFLSYSSSPIADITDNKIVDEINQINARIGATSGAINAVLNENELAQIRESPQDLNEILADLQSLEVLKNSGAIPSCLFRLSASSGSIGPAGGAATVAVQSGDGCTATATTNAGWLSLSAPIRGNGVLVYAAAANPDPNLRFAVILIGEQLFRVTQFGNDGSSSNPAPSVVSLLPANTTAGSGPLTLVVNGTNFVPGAAVQWKGINRSTTFLDSTHLQAAISASDIASPGTVTLTVFNPPPGGGISSDLVFTIDAPSPVGGVPAVAILVPAAGATVSGQTIFTAVIGDSTPLSAVQFAVDNLAIGPNLTSPPYVVSFDTRSVNNGPHVLSVSARDAAGQSATQSLSFNVVNGVDFTLSIAPGSSNSASVIAGQTATYLIQVAPANGFGSPIVFTCGSLPPGISCSFDPNPWTASSAPSSIVKLSVNTAKRNASSLGLGSFLNGLQVLFVLAVLAMGLMMTTRPKRRLHYALSFCVLFLTVLFVTSCGGGKQSSIPSPIPSTSRLTIIVTGTSGSSIQSLNLDLNIN